MKKIMQAQQRIRELTKNLINKVEKIDHKSIKDFILSDLKEIQDEQTVVENSLIVKQHEERNNEKGI
tara:strand:+ start:114 stop:314 length:201 start_codon:yes stop_codon:yes gene_type:complete